MSETGLRDGITLTVPDQARGRVAIILLTQDKESAVPWGMNVRRVPRWARWSSFVSGPVWLMVEATDVLSFVAAAAGVPSPWAMWSVRVLLVATLLAWPVMLAVHWIGWQRIVRIFSRNARVERAAAELVEVWDKHGIPVFDQTMAMPELPSSESIGDAD